MYLQQCVQMHYNIKTHILRLSLSYEDNQIWYEIAAR